MFDTDSGMASDWRIPSDAPIIGNHIAKRIEAALPNLRADFVSAAADGSYLIRVVDLMRKPAGIVSQSKGV
jgi:hypothetical protein